AGLIAEGRAAMTIGHEQTPVAQTQQVRRKPPYTDAVRLAPCLPAITGFRLQGLAGVRLVVIADVRDDRAILRLHCVEFVVIPGLVARAGFDLGEPLPGLAVVGGFADTGLLVIRPELLAG